MLSGSTLELASAAASDDDGDRSVGREDAGKL